MLAVFDGNDADMAAATGLTNDITSSSAIDRALGLFMKSDHLNLPICSSENIHLILTFKFSAAEPIDTKKEKFSGIRLITLPSRVYVCS